LDAVQHLLIKTLLKRWFKTRLMASAGLQRTRCPENPT
jgi:hypothetical protein